MLLLLLLLLLLRLLLPLEGILQHVEHVLGQLLHSFTQDVQAAGAAMLRQHWQVSLHCCLDLLRRQQLLLWLLLLQAEEGRLWMMRARQVRAGGKAGAAAKGRWQLDSG